MSEATIMSVVIDEMKKAQRSIVTGGEDKKAYVMQKIKDNIMDDDTYERYEPILIVIVDIIKQIATDKKLLDGLHNSKCFKSMFKCIEKQ